MSENLYCQFQRMQHRPAQVLKFLGLTSDFVGLIMYFPGMPSFLQTNDRRPSEKCREGYDLPNVLRHCDNVIPPAALLRDTSAR